MFLKFNFFCCLTKNYDLYSLEFSDPSVVIQGCIVSVSHFCSPLSGSGSLNFVDHTHCILCQVCVIHDSHLPPGRHFQQEKHTNRQARKRERDTNTQKSCQKIICIHNLSFFLPIIVALGIVVIIQRL